MKNKLKIHNTSTNPLCRLTRLVMSRTNDSKLLLFIKNKNFDVYNISSFLYGFMSINDSIDTGKTAEMDEFGF